MFSPRDSGQALVETALTLPLVVFLVLGTLQLFMMYHGRLMAEYAVFRATRAGAVDFGHCTRMKHAAIAALLPTFTTTVSRAGGLTHGQVLGEAFGQRRNGRFNPALDHGHDGEIVWLIRERPTPADLARATDDNFDEPIVPTDNREPVRLEVRMVFWYPLRIPFANWVMARMFLAAYDLKPYTAINPLSPTRQAKWTEHLSTLEARVGAELRRRVDAQQYTFPIQATHVMRMMTPARPVDFAQPECP